MPKPMLKQSQSQPQSILSAVQSPAQKQQVQQTDRMKLDRLLRRSRSKEYMNAVCQLDAGGHVHNQHRVNEIIDTIRNEFPEVELAGILLGIVAVCYLGTPYEVHILDMAHQITEHYKAGEPLPDGLEKVRAIAMRGGYAFIEVYTDCCRCVSSSGAVSVISG